MAFNRLHWVFESLRIKTPITFINISVHPNFVAYNTIHQQSKGKWQRFQGPRGKNFQSQKFPLANRSSKKPNALLPRALKRISVFSVLLLLSASFHLPSPPNQ